MNKKFFFFDIDGTLAVGTPGRQYIPESTKKAIRMLKEQGHFVAIATGRSYAMAVDHMRSLGFENMVSDGGNGITIDNELITIKPLDYQKCLNLIDECKEKGFIWAISPDNKTRRLAPDQRFYDFTHDVYMDTEVVDGLDPRNYDQIFKGKDRYYLTDSYEKYLNEMYSDPSLLDENKRSGKISVVILSFIMVVVAVIGYFVFKMR